jgi:hypothetical protein
MLTAPHLAILASAYTKATNTSLAALGSAVFNDHRFFKRLSSGLDCTTSSAAKASDWFAENWPENAEWPAGILRPVAEKERAA